MPPDLKNTWHKGATEDAPLAVRRIGVADLWDALARGLADFEANRTDVIFLCVIYPVIGLVLGRLASGYGLLPLLFPLASGFALVGPFAAVGLNEISRRREQGSDVRWVDAFGVLRSPSIGAILLLGLMLIALFLLWLVVAQIIYVVTLGPQPPASVAGFISEVFTTSAGWTMIVVGIGAGFPVRAAGACGQRRVVSAAARSQRRHRHRHIDIGARRVGQSRRHGAMGADRRLWPGGWVGAAVRRPGGGPAGARACDMAPVSQGGAPPRRRVRHAVPMSLREA